MVTSLPTSKLPSVPTLVILGWLAVEIVPKTNPATTLAAVALPVTASVPNVPTEVI